MNQSVEQRGAVAIIVYADIPIVWFSVEWWNSLCQLQSNMTMFLRCTNRAHLGFAFSS